MSRGQPVADGRRSAIALWVIALLQGTSAPYAIPQSAPYLALRTAEIFELDEATSSGTTEVMVFRLRLGAAPPCDGDRRPAVYTFLLDTDRSAKTGVVTRAFPEIGIETKLEIRCDPQLNALIGPSGRVSVVPHTERGVEMDVRLPKSAVKAEEFDWIAVARDGSRYDRIPSKGAATWRSAKVSLW